MVFSLHWNLQWSWYFKVKAARNSNSGGFTLLFLPRFCIWTAPTEEQHNCMNYDRIFSIDAICITILYPNWVYFTPLFWQFAGFPCQQICTHWRSAWTYIQWNGKNEPLIATSELRLKRKSISTGFKCHFSTVAIEQPQTNNFTFFVL